jgi:hypothetical protein
VSAISSSLRPVRSLAVVATGGLALPLAVELVRLFPRINRVRLVLSSEAARRATLASSDHMIRTLAILYAVSYLIAGTAFIAWLFRVRANAEIIGGATQKYTVVWLTIGWIAPVVNLWVPRRIIIDVWRASAAKESVRRPPVLITAWWVCYLVGTNGGNLLATLLSKGHATKAITIVFALMSVFDIMAAILAVVLVWRIVGLQVGAGHRLAAMPGDVVVWPDQAEASQRKQAAILAVSLGGVLVLFTVLRLLPHVLPSHSHSQSPEERGYAYGTANSDPLVSDCEKEGKRRYSNQIQEIGFEVGCVKAQTDALVNAAESSPPR